MHFKGISDQDHYFTTILVISFSAVTDPRIISGRQNSVKLRVLSSEVDQLGVNLGLPLLPM